MDNATILLPLSQEDANFLISFLKDFKEGKLIPQVNTPEKEDNLISIGESATILKCCEKTVSNRIRTGKLTAYRSGGQIRLKKSEVEDSLKKIAIKKRF